MWLTYKDFGYWFLVLAQTYSMKLLLTNIILPSLLPSFERPVNFILNQNLSQKPVINFELHNRWKPAESHSFIYPNLLTRIASIYYLTQNMMWRH